LQASSFAAVGDQIDADAGQLSAITVVSGTFGDQCLTIQCRLPASFHGQADQ
jgi:hypothetical protein